MNDFLTQKIIGAAIEVHKNLGCWLLESIYEEALCYELELRGIKFLRQVEIDVIYKSRVIKGQRIDLLIENEVIVEIKSVSKLAEVFYGTNLILFESYRLKTRTADKLWRKTSGRWSKKSFSISSVFSVANIL